MREHNFYSNGKLLITGEYFVLDGATALAIPTSFGQSLSVTKVNTNTLEWKSLTHNDNIWFHAIFELPNLSIQGDLTPEKKILENILREAKKLNPSFLEKSAGLLVNTKLDFPRDWGLGTSSTLINNIAQWAQVNAFDLLENSFGGSGYDIAAAQASKAILYNKEEDSRSREVYLPWEFKEKLFFVHLNKKQDSKKGIAHYYKHKVTRQQIQRISDLSQKLLMCHSLGDFEKLMESHETIISETLQLPKIKTTLFNDYPNLIKSLGAWGGDFVLAIGEEKDKDYFLRKGYTTIIPFQKMIR